jgi:hypothetical protein
LHAKKRQDRQGPQPDGKLQLIGADGCYLTAKIRPVDFPTYSIPVADDAVVVILRK